jgi:hypothetical protein
MMDGSGQRPQNDTTRSAKGLERWHVFVLLRDRPGLHERTVEASGAMDAEHRVATTDRMVLETLGSQHVPATDGDASADIRYRRIQSVGRRFLSTHPRAHRPVARPFLEVVAPLR